MHRLPWNSFSPPSGNSKPRMAVRPRNRLGENHQDACGSGAGRSTETFLTFFKKIPAFLSSPSVTVCVAETAQEGSTVMNETSAPEVNSVPQTIAVIATQKNGSTDIFSRKAPVTLPKEFLGLNLDAEDTAVVLSVFDAQNKGLVAHLNYKLTMGTAFRLFKKKYCKAGCGTYTKILEAFDFRSQRAKHWIEFADAHEARGNVEYEANVAVVESDLQLIVSSGQLVGDFGSADTPAAAKDQSQVTPAKKVRKPRPKGHHLIQSERFKCRRSGQAQIPEGNRR
jgi:hypothetical protein